MPSPTNPVSTPVIAPTPTPKSIIEVDNQQVLQVTGYFENWYNVEWYNGDIPGKCYTGCLKEEEIKPLLPPYTTINYSFVLTSAFLDYDQGSCESCLLYNSGTETAGGALDVCCPAFGNEGFRFYNARYKGAGLENGGRGEPSIVVDWRDLENDPVLNADADQTTGGRGQGVLYITDFCRIVKESGKKCLVALGGWSDWTRVADNDRADKIARLAAELVLWTFADGLDIDFEHLYEFDKIWPGEFDAFSHMVNRMRFYLDTYVKEKWQSAIDARLEFVRSSGGEYLNKHRNYMQGLKAMPTPENFVLSFTTRFNGFVDPEDPFNYRKPGTYTPSEHFSSDDEARKVWALAGDSLDQINIMAYDASMNGNPIVLDHKQILLNFEKGGVPKHKIVMGFEPIGKGKDYPGRTRDNEQAAGGIWEGYEEDIEVAKFVAENCYGGAMAWAMNDPIALEYRNGDPLIDVLMMDMNNIFEESREKCAGEVQGYTPAPTEMKLGETPSPSLKELGGSCNENDDCKTMACFKKKCVHFGLGSPCWVNENCESNNCNQDYSSAFGLCVAGDEPTKDPNDGLTPKQLCKKQKTVEDCEKYAQCSAATKNGKLKKCAVVKCKKIKDEESCMKAGCSLKTKNGGFAGCANA